MAEGDHDRGAQLRVVASAGSGPEAELMCQILAAEGIPALQQRLIDNPEFGQAGARSILVKASDVERARDALGLEPAPQSAPARREPSTTAVPKRRIWERLLGRARRGARTDEPGRRDERDEQAAEGH